MNAKKTQLISMELFLCYLEVWVDPSLHKLKFHLKIPQPTISNFTLRSPSNESAVQNEELGLWLSKPG